jgi:hypothetical protein
VALASMPPAHMAEVDEALKMVLNLG